MTAPRATSFSSTAMRTSVMTSLPRSWNWRITSARTSLEDVRTRSRSRRAPGDSSATKRLGGWPIHRLSDGFTDRFDLLAGPEGLDVQSVRRDGLVELGL